MEFSLLAGNKVCTPSLMVGNTIVLKPASATMQCGIEIENTFHKAGVPEGVFQTLIGDSTIAETLIDSKGINAVTFTGERTYWRESCTESHVTTKEDGT